MKMSNRHSWLGIRCPQIAVSRRNRWYALYWFLIVAFLAYYSLLWFCCTDH
jgi:hypothetical protein